MLNILCLMYNNVELIDVNGPAEWFYRTADARAVRWGGEMRTRLDSNFDTCKVAALFRY